MVRKKSKEEWYFMTWKFKHQGPVNEHSWNWACSHSFPWNLLLCDIGKLESEDKNMWLRCCKYYLVLLRKGLKTSDLGKLPREEAWRKMLLTLRCERWEWPTHSSERLYLKCWGRINTDEMEAVFTGMWALNDDFKRPVCTGDQGRPVRRAVKT